MATVALFVYLPMSTSPELEQLSEAPEPLTALFGGGVALCIVILWITRKRPAFGTEALRKPMRVGTWAACIGFALYVTYVYAFSQTLPGAESAPRVGQVAPNFEVEDPDGRVFNLEDTRGTPVLLVFYRGQW